MQTFFATTPKGLELLLVDELLALGATTAKEKLAVVEFTGDLKTAYQACLWSRLANRILLPLAKFPASTQQELYAGIKNIDWSQHLKKEGTLAVNFVSSHSQINHSLFGAQKVKDAIVDQFKERFGVRPSVSKEHPDLQLFVYLHRDQAEISIDLSGESLHKRGYRLASTGAPLKENLAAAMLIRAGWPKIAKEGGSLMDPMCGSGTLLVEGALMAANVAPGLLRDYFGFLGWRKHDAQLWKTLVQDAKNKQDLKQLPQITGYDCDPHSIKAAFSNIERAGMLGKVHVEKRELSDFEPKQTSNIGLVIVNPPYGERLGEIEDLKPLYTKLGIQLKEHFIHWHAAVLAGNPELGKEMGLRSYHQYALFNGSIPCKLLLFKIESAYFVERSIEADNKRLVLSAKRAIKNDASDAIQIFINRFKKNIRHLGRQAKREGKTRYRVYDADLPDYAFAIDLEDNAAYVQEYEAPRNINPVKVAQRRQQVLAVLPELLNLPPENIYYSLIPK